MRRSIIKKRFSITFEFSSSTPPSGLIGCCCEYDTSEDSLIIYIDLSPNLRTKFKQEDTYSDALDLNTNRDEIAAFTIMEDGVIDRIVDIISRNKDKELWFIFKLDEYPEIKMCMYVEPIYRFMRVVAVKQSQRT